MDIRKLSPFVSVSPQLNPQEMQSVADRGFKAVINNRPDGESDDQPASTEMESAAKAAGLVYRHIPVIAGRLNDDNIAEFESAIESLTGPVLAFCRSGTRSATLWALSSARHLDVDAILETCASVGYNLSADRPRLKARASQSAAQDREGRQAPPTRAPHHEIVIIGGGSAGISAAASLLKRRPTLDIVIIEPREQHFYQPGWTLVGGGVFDSKSTVRPMAKVMPQGVTWMRTAAADFDPERSEIILEDGSRMAYSVLIVAPGIKLDWGAVEGLHETLGKNGVTSNYVFDLAPYTWELVKTLNSGTALFTQPPLPFKCAGAPQKAMYLACDHWLRSGRMKDMDVGFYNAGGALFGVADYVPALMRYIERYGIDLKFTHNLVGVDGLSKTARFAHKSEDGNTQIIEKKFDMLHVCPPQTAPDFIRSSSLANDGGWVAVNQETLQHSTYDNIFSLGDVCSAPNAKTAAAVRKQAPVVAKNILSLLQGKTPHSIYDGYGSCPLTVERGKIVLAEFGYGGKLLPTFPTWLIDGTQPSRLAWFLKEKLLPGIYWHLMLKGHEWLTD